MAASLSRPDPSSPASVAEAGFSTTRRGYHQDEVRAFLSSVASELARLQERQRQLEAELHTARSAPLTTLELDDETVAAMLGEETLRVLHTARESASEIKIRAEENAARVVREATEEANRIRQETEVEAARKRYDSSADAEAEVTLAKQQGREMVNEARSYRERVLADLERRTTLARHQIEELLHGRDRLLQVFERARLVAVDVTSDLQAIDSPDQLVNLAHTTGPVPLMVPNGRPAPRTADVADRPTGDTPVTGDADHGAVDSTDDTDDTETAELTGHTDHGDSDSAEASTELIDIVDAAETGLLAEGAELDTAADVTPAPVRDANVVSLFRGRVAPHPADLAEDDEADEADDVDQIAAETADQAGDEPAEPDDRHDVGGIFARLRSEVPPSAPEPAVHVDEPAHDAEITATADDVTVAAAEITDDADLDVLEAQPTPFSRRDEAIVPLIVAGARRIKRALADEQNGVLDALRQQQPVTSLDELLPELDEHLAVYAEVLQEELLSAAAAGAGELGINDTKTLRRKLSKTGAVESAHDLLRTDLLRPLRERLARAVSDGAGDNEDITKRVRSVYREWKTQHIDDQLDDVFRFAHGGGMAVSIEPGTTLSWTIDPGHPACPDCEDNSLAGSTAAGEAFPTGHTSAPAHPGCRCLTLPNGQ